MTTKTLLSLKILSPEETVFEIDQLTAVNIPLTNGVPIGVRPGHAPLIAETAKGKVRYRSANGEQNIELYGGVLDIRNNIITILTAGEIKETPTELAQPIEIEYERLMQTLIKKLASDETATIESTT